MIDKPLNQITYADIDQFVQEKRPEGKTVDYKRDAYGNRDEDKKELLKDTSSFANTQGGDILIGVDEDKGVPTGIPGVTVPDIDKEKLRLEEIIRRGLDPRIEFACTTSRPRPAPPSSSSGCRRACCSRTVSSSRGSSASFGPGVQRGSIQWTRTNCGERSRCRP